MLYPLIVRSLSNGQKIFAIVFVAAFVLVMIFTYRKDLKQTKHTYNKVYRMFVYIAMLLGFYWVLLQLLN